jgi:NitT/TauT family transport system permease protein
MPLILPSPIDVAIKLGEMALTWSFWRVMMVSALRVTVGIAFSYAGGFLLAILCRKIRFFYDLMVPVISVIKTTPVSSFILIALVFFNRDLIPGAIAALMVFPIVFSNTMEGLSAPSAAMLETAKVYKLSMADRIRCIWIPTLRPFMVSAAGACAGLAIKAGIAAEVLISPEVSIGKYMYSAKQNMEYVELFAWTLAVIIFSFLVDYIFKLILNRMKKSIKKEAVGDENH